ncbi:CLUMA_CG016224, isoform A [Clunio marinus]|uniref:CLUMA_CG016224, isoform A n=1 Tax=Clunio marinus TaxID=568069 RepID=A0A1J1IS43_9DIPT|nr:CLUMA_CG016224, isoform A [Clunio marinus]
MLDKRKSSLLAIVAFLGFLSTVDGQGNRRIADAEPKYVATQEGQTLNLMCRIALPITSCRFIIPGVPEEIKLNPTWKRNDNFRYHGSGLENGNCGLTILSIRKEYHGNATCILDPNDGGLDAIGNIEIVIAKAPQLPVIESSNIKDLEADKEIEVECSSVDGRPAANITWYLDDQLLGPGEEEIVDSPNEGTIYYTVYSKLRYRVRPDDNTRFLICRAYHPGYPEGFADARMQLNVNYRPLAKPETIISGLEIGSTATIGPISIQANPRPTLRWTVDGVVIDEGQQTQRYVANEPIQVGVSIWNASLTIIELTLQDTTRTYQLRASNAFGATDYRIRIGGSQDAPDSGLGIVSIVAITIISLLVLVIVVLVVVAKITKRWCFAGDSMHPNGPDSEAQIAPEDDKTHEHYEQHEKSADDEPETGADDVVIKATNGKAKGNTSV